MSPVDEERRVYSTGTRSAEKRMPESQYLCEDGSKGGVMKNFRKSKAVKFIAASMAAVMALSACSGSSSGNLPDESEAAVTEAAGVSGSDVAESESTGPKSYTFHDYSTSLIAEWNPHTYSYDQSGTFIDYLSQPFVTPTILDSEEGIFQWAYCMATYMEDVTAEHPEDMEKYGSILPDQYDSYDEVKENFVFEIGLNPDACWENGEKITADDYITSMKWQLDPEMKNYRATNFYSGDHAICGAYEYYSGETDDFDTVGLYKVDDYTIRMVMLNGESLDSRNATILNRTWLVYEPLYTAGFEYTEGLLTTNYCTSAETTMSYGPYRIESYQPDKQIVFTQNENWWGWEEDEDGTLVSYTDFDVDGGPVRQYYPTKIVVDVMTNDAAKQLYLNGELSRWTPAADDLMVYGSSERLYKSDLAYCSRIIFNTNLDVLESCDTSKGNTNSVVLSSRTFRNAISLAMDRNELVTATKGYRPSTMLLHKLFYYDIFDNPTSVFRNSDEAMEAMCNFYGVEWGEGTPYATLKEAADSVTGYNLTAAHELFEQAFDELVADGLYTEGEDIVVRLAYSGGAMSSADNAFFALLNSEINAAMEGTGFGTFTFEPYDNIANRNDALKNGEWAACIGAWGGPTTNPFTMMRSYLDPEQVGIEESVDLDFYSEMWTIEVDGEPITMSMVDWVRSINGLGVYGDGTDWHTRLSILAQLETNFLDLYLCIPYAAQVNNEMFSYQCQYYTDTYNPLYALGDLRLIQFNYDDDEWAAYVASQGGTLNYE